MNEQQAIALVKKTFQSAFDRSGYIHFLKNLLNEFDDEGARTNQGAFIPDKFRNYVEKLERVGKYKAADGEALLFIVWLKSETSLERARTMQRNFIAHYLQMDMKDAALVAFVSKDPADWRFSFIKMEYRYDEAKNKIREEFTPAKRWSFLVGAHEASHTAQRKLVPLMADDEHNPTLADLEDAFNIEKVTKEFFEKYRGLFIRTKEALDEAVSADPKLRREFESKGIDTVNFAKKLLGQIVFLYYLQKKGWFGVARDAAWGQGSRNFLRELFDKKHGEYQNFFNDILEPLFYDALRRDRSEDDHYYPAFRCKIPFLNGGLFDPMNNYDWVKTDILLPNELFHNQTKTKEGDVGDGILDIFDRYNFTVKEDEPFEKEVAIDPELLGKAYEKFNAIRPDNYDEFLQALKSGKKGDESKFNKQYGVYYTPREIVHYMCQQSLINYLYSEVSGDKELGNQELGIRNYPTKDDFATLILKGEQIKEHDERVAAEGRETRDYPFIMPESIRNHAALIDEKLASIKVCDPAVGSGAFPVGMMNEIVRAREVLRSYLTAKSANNAKEEQKEEQKNLGDLRGLSGSKSIYDFKRACIENSLYGVDIDPGAVEIAKLRLWLSLVVDEDDIQNIKPLPNLDYKIVCGNSLLGVEKNLFNNHLFAELEALKPLYFNETNISKKKEYKARIDGLIEQITDGRKQFDFEIYFSEVFHENGGFDILIANPPYVRQEEIKELKPTLQKQFECYTGTSDLFVYFYEKGVRLLRENGILTFISSNKYFRSGYGEKLRAYLGSKTSIRQIIDFGDAPIFDAIAYPSILVTQKTSPNENQFNVLSWKLDEPLERFYEAIETQTFVMWQSDLTAGGWQLENKFILNLLEKMRHAGKPLGEYVGGRFYYGIKTGLNEAFVVDKETHDRLIAQHPSSKEVLKPFLRGRDIKRWQVNYQDLWLLFIPWHFPLHLDNSIKGASQKAEKEFSKRYPAVYEYLLKFKKELSNRNKDETDIRYEWYALQRWGADYWQEFDKPKIIIPAIAQNVEYAPDFDGYFTNDKTSICITENVNFLLGILNSQLLWWFIKQTAASKQGGFYEFKPMYVSQIPIVEPNNTKPVEKLVDRILAAKAENPQADTSALEQEIDQLVYQLYGLTEEEIRIVEGR